MTIDQYKKLAKALVRAVREGEADAIARVRAVYADATTESAAVLAESFGVQRAQHVIAKEHGFTDWAAVLTAPPVEVKLARVMRQHPWLTMEGMHYPDRRLSPAENDARFAAARAKLRTLSYVEHAELEDIVAWLRENIEQTATINRSTSSYGLKHIVEKDIGYVANGALIAAALIAGYPCDDRDLRINVHFGMSARSIKAVTARRLKPSVSLKPFVRRAAEILRARGLAPEFGSSRDRLDLVWREGNEMRTVRIDAYSNTPFLPRVYLDHFAVFASRATARKMGLTTPYSHTEIHPTRANSEITVTLDELASALEWALRDAPELRSAPFAVITSGDERSQSVRYVWSQRAHVAWPKGQWRVSA